MAATIQPRPHVPAEETLGEYVAAMASAILAMRDEHACADAKALARAIADAANPQACTGEPGKGALATLTKAFAGDMVAGGGVRAPAAPDRLAIKMLVGGGYVTEAKANEALNIAHGFAKGPLAPWRAPLGVEELCKEASEVLEAVGNSGVTLPDNWRWPLADELGGIAALAQKSTAHPDEAVAKPLSSD